MPQPTKKRKRLSLSSRLNLWIYQVTMGMLARVRPPRWCPPVLGEGSRVLVFSSAGLGDSLLDSVAFRALHESFPEIHIEVVVHHRRPDISRHNPFIRKLHYLRKGPPAFLRLLAELRADGPWDAILYLSCLDPEARSFGYLLNRHSTVGLGWKTEMPYLCARNIDCPEARDAHLARQALLVAEALGATTGYPRMIYEVSEGDRMALAGRLGEWGMPPKPKVVFQLGGGGAAYRDWPVAHFVELARKLHASGVGPIFVLGGPDHRSKAAAFAEQVGDVPFLDVIGRLPLPLSAALIEASDCLVSTDTGIMHLGFAIGTPTVALLHCQLGAARVGPLADLETHELLEIPRPAAYRSPSDASMEKLAPGDVFDAVRRILGRGRARLRPSRS
jgi:ADP-heptose:LPS heptosyltransferase